VRDPIRAPPAAALAEWSTLESAACAILNVVLLDDVRCGSIHKGGKERRCTTARYENFAWSVRWAHCDLKLFENADRPRPTARQGAAKPIDKRFLCARHDFSGQILQAQTRKKMCKETRGVVL
jgi:hypothetical protein